VSDQTARHGWWQASDGRWYPPAPSGPSPSINVLAVVSLASSVVIFGVGWIAGIVCGVIARRQIRASGGAQTGDGVALAGIIVGAAYLGSSVAFVAVDLTWHLILH
jgi:hypothetical protein